jgi:hypothetical protein
VGDGAATPREGPRHRGRASFAWGNAGAVDGQAIVLPVTRPIAQNALMKYAVYMVGALAVIVVGSITWSTMLLNSH